MSRTAMLAFTTAAAIVLAGGSPSASSQAQTAGQAGSGQKMTDQMAGRDEDFIKEVAQSSQVELAASTLAMAKASNAEVKAFAEKLVKDHTAASQELAALVDAKGVMLPEDDPGLKAKKQKHESLQKLTGAEFDKEYLEDMISDHESAMALFGRQAQFGKDAAVKAFAEKTLPTLRDHLKAARDLRAKIAK